MLWGLSLLPSAPPWEGEAPDEGIEEEEVDDVEAAADAARRAWAAAAAAAAAASGAYSAACGKTVSGSLSGPGGWIRC
jgi:hypothetical protein